MCMISNLEMNRQGLNEVLFSLIKKEKTRELSLTITKVEEAIMWLEKAIAMAQPTLFDNIPESNPNQGMLNFDAPVVEEPKEKKPKIKKEKVEVVEPTSKVESTEKPAEKLPSKEDVIFMAKEYSKKHGSGEAFLRVLETFGATKISEIYAKGDAAVRNLVDSIRI